MGKQGYNLKKIINTKVIDGLSIGDIVFFISMIYIGLKIAGMV